MTRKKTPYSSPGATEQSRTTSQSLLQCFISSSGSDGQSEFLIIGLNGYEAISELFSFDVQLASLDSAIDVDTLVGKRIDIGIRSSNNGGIRFIDGFVCRVSRLGTEGRFVKFQAQVVPWLWFLTLSTDCRSYQNMTVPQIVARVFEEAGFRDFSDNTKQAYPQVEYCAQYRETSCDFVLRLLEREGIFFYFLHERGRHTLVFSDSASVHQPLKPLKASFKRFKGSGRSPEMSALLDWCPTSELRSKVYASKDFNFKEPRNQLLAEAALASESVYKSERFDYPGGFDNRDQGDEYCKMRLDADNVAQLAVRGSGTCRHFTCGFLFEATQLDRRQDEGVYLLTSVFHNASEELAAGAASGNRSEYSNTFTCIKRSTRFRPAIRTRKPSVRGPQTAIVVGPAGEEIFTDSYGRVKVQFHWDRRGRSDENSSCWIRVAQPVAGKGWGFAAVPRIGQEVVVQFLEGDPDRPVIVGSLYNAENQPPYTLPGNQTQSGLRSRSTKAGERENFNEIRFEDRKSSEELLIHAERRKQESVEEDSYYRIGQDRKSLVGRNQIEHVKGSSHALVNGELRVKIDGTMSQQIGGDRHEKIGSLSATEAGDEIHLKSGVKIVIEAGSQITIRGPGGFIDVGPDGVTIQGTLVRINSGGSGGQGSAANPKSPEILQDNYVDL